MTYAASLGCHTAAITCNPGSELSAIAEAGIDVNTGPEVLSGSTRFKAGTAQKMILNMISTAAMVKAGILGIGEPLIYSVTLPMGRPFITAGLGAGMGGAFVMAMQVAATTWGPSGLPGCLVMTAGPSGALMSVLFYLIGLLISIGEAYVITDFAVSDELVRNA